jgi:hypothetical protein
MPNTINIIADSLNSYHMGIVSMPTDTLRHIVYNIPAPVSFKWTDYLKPSIDLLIALITAFILVWKYLTQKQKEFAERIIENKRNAYSEFLKNFTETAIKVMYEKNTSGIKCDKERMLARNQLLLYANDKVIKAYHDWIEYADTDNHDIDKEVELFGKILVEIRKDIHGDSKLTEQEISNLNPFNRG